MLKIAGDSGSLHVLFGRAYRDGDFMQDAIREFNRAIALDPRTPHAHYFLGLAQLVLSDWKPTPGAEAALRTEAEYYPNDYLANLAAIYGGGLILIDCVGESLSSATPVRRWRSWKRN